MNNTSSTTISFSVIPQEVKLAFYIVLLILGLAGNITLLSVLWKREIPKDVFELLVINLSIADVLFHLFYIAPNIHRLADSHFEISEFHCKFLYPFSTVVYCSQIFTITAMSLHRYWVVVYSYKTKPSRRAAVIWIFTIWAVSFIMAVPLIVVSKPILPGNCLEAWPSLSHRQAFTVSLFLIQYAIPLAVIAVAYLKLVLFLVRDPGRQVSKMNLQVVKTTSCIVIIFAVCMFPSQLSWILFDFAIEKINSKVHQTLWSVGDLALSLHAVLDPIVYGVFVKRFRKAYIGLFLSLFYCCRAVCKEKKQRLNSEDITIRLGKSTERE